MYRDYCKKKPTTYCHSSYTYRRGEHWFSSVMFQRYVLAWTFGVYAEPACYVHILRHNCIFTHNYKIICIPLLQFAVWSLAGGILYSKKCGTLSGNYLSWTFLFASIKLRECHLDLLQVRGQSSKNPFPHSLQYYIDHHIDHHVLCTKNNLFLIKKASWFFGSRRHLTKM